MNKDLTVGDPQKELWKFSIPLFLSVIFQQLYSIADSVIAGKFAGEDALAAVGASYPITMIFMAVAIGSNVGCTVVISQLFGSKEYHHLKTAISTSVIASAVISVILTVFGIVCSGAMMKLVSTPDNIFADGNLYLRIYIGGFLFLFLYNVANGIFTSLGDSKTPLYFLIGSSIGNIVLDLLFVAVCHWGVAGVAWATFLAQGAACVLAVWKVKTRVDAIPIQQAELQEEVQEVFSWSMLGRISKIAIPSIFQQSFISIGNIFIQNLINGFGSSVIAGYSAAVKLNTFTLTCFTTLSTGVSSFAAQNLGAGKEDRVRAGLRGAMKMAWIITIPFFLVFFFGGSLVLRMFVDSSSVTAIETGRVFLMIIAPFYFVISIKIIVEGVIKGAGAMKAFMISTFADLIIRVVISYILAVPFGTTGIWLSWPIGWTVGALLAVYFYRQGVWRVDLASGEDHKVRLKG